MAASVYRAVADPRRRQLLDALRDHGDQSLSGLCEDLRLTSDISRQAVSKHLAVLEQAGLVRVSRRGRERVHRLDAAPLAGLATWVSTYATFWEDRLDALAAALSEEQERADP